ncbi:hypothetical protein EST38_g331 [Candolleomyces aberdarensis]|uniref:Major facilitator superfamily (MFS) profile domain-containing protein n=1 Tax=Candolleomyces aberdarensis TaxID=2316362 RepID=A0A4V1Q5G8_9AGAR|nr:hypothetical protein EST38_g331 [Candolleomyces aberdarensis]
MTATQNIDEETPLLTNGQSKKPTPLPWTQFSIVLFLQLAEPLTSNVIYPFMPQLIRDLGVTNGNDAAVGYYVGMMQSIFFLTQAFTVLHWARLSDTIGRKPVILVGLFGLTVSMYCFGLSRTFWGLVLSRSLSGALNGNIGVIKSMVAELTDETNLAQAYAYMPIAWSTGCTVGPMIGGSLSRPHEQYPWLFGDSPFHKKYPYFLACSIPATFSAIAWVVTYRYLKETHTNPTPVKQYLGIEKKPLIDDDSDSDSVDSSIAKEETPGSLRSLLTPRVVVAATNYAFLSLVDIAFRAIQPVFFSTPIELGGLGLDPARIGSILSISGILNGCFQVFFFAAINNRLGSKRTFIMGIASAVPLFVCYPLMSVVAQREGLSSLVWVLVLAQIVFSIGISLSYGSIFIFITAASPNRASLGATNGLCQMTVSVMRAIGPAAANSLFSISIEKGLLGGWLVYYVLLATTFVTIFVGTFLPQKLWTQN